MHMGMLDPQIETQRLQHHILRQRRPCALLDKLFITRQQVGDTSHVVQDLENGMGPSRLVFGLRGQQNGGGRDVVPTEKVHRMEHVEAVHVNHCGGDRQGAEFQMLLRVMDYGGGYASDERLFFLVVTAYVGGRVSDL